MLGGYEAWMGTYDNRSVWDFICLRGLPGDYVIMNEGGEKWWKEYGEDAMQILATLKQAEEMERRMQEQFDAIKRMEEYAEEKGKIIINN